MVHEEGHFRTHDGLELYRQAWLPEGEPRANLAVIHGVGEHSGRYAELAAWFNDAGYAIYTFDHRGHGKSPGQRGHIDAWSDFREDVRVFLGQVREASPDLPLFLVGHSMGALIVLDYGLRYGEQDSGELRSLQGIVASAPPLAWGDSVSPITIFLGKALSSVLPRMQMSSGLDAAGLSHDEEVVEAYRSDPLVHGLVSPRFGAEMDRTMQATLAAAESWPAGMPLLIIHGCADPICPPEASRHFFERAGAEDKVRHEYAGFLHESFNEVGREQVFEDLKTWLEAHLA